MSTYIHPCLFSPVMSSENTTVDAVHLIKLGKDLELILFDLLDIGRLYESAYAVRMSRYFTSIDPRCYAFDLFFF